MSKIEKSDAEWREALTPEAYRVLREHGTERAGTSHLNHERSSVVPTAPSAMGAKKLGQPVPDSNFVCASNSGCPQHTHAKVPARFSLR